MAKKQSVYIRMRTPIFRLSYPHVTEPWAGNNGGEPKYQIQMIFPKTAEGDVDLWALIFKGKPAIPKSVRAVCTEVAQAFWNPANDPKIKLPGGIKKPLHDADKEENEKPEYAGCIFANARTKDKPVVFDAMNEPVTDDMKIKELLYPGCWCRATISVGAGDTGGSPYVHFALNNIQFMEHGDRFDNRMAASEDFDPVLVSAAGGEFAGDPVSF